MSTQYKTYSLNIRSVENLKKTMKNNDISFRGDADAIHKAIDKYITDFRLKSNPHFNFKEKAKEGSS